jgi:hypothetical protein
MQTQVLKSLLTLFISTPFFFGFSQEKNTQEITLAYGNYTSNELLSVIEDFSLIFLTNGKATSDNYRFSGASSINYSYAIKDNLMLGVEAAYERIKKDLFVEKTKVAEQTDNALSIGAHAKYSYIANPKFRMYSGLAAGYVTIQGTSKPESGTNYKASKGNTGRFRYHLTGFGFRYGKKAAVVAELGFGYKGILNVGFNYRF